MSIDTSKPKCETEQCKQYSSHIASVWDQESKECYLGWICDRCHSNLGRVKGTLYA